MNWQSIAGISIATIAVLTLGVYGGFLDEELDKSDQTAEMQKFSSQEEFIQYLQNSRTQSSYSSFQQNTMARQDSLATEGDAAGTSPDTSVERYSTTNVQEQGIQEADILKTDGENFYFSPEQDYRIRPMLDEELLERDTVAPRRYISNPNTSVINTLPIENVSEKAEIEANGEMMLQDNQLVMFEDRKITGFDVETPYEPQRDWSIDLNGSVETSRIKDGELFVVVSQRASTDNPCPYVAADSNERLTIPCNDIYRPISDVSVDSTYTVMRVNPSNGEIEASTSVVGSNSNTVVYMSEGSIYVTYTKRKSESEIMFEFFTEEGSNLVDSDTQQRIQQLQDYDISDRSKQIELQRTLDDYRKSLSGDEQKEWSQRMENAFGNYSEQNKREFSSTGIARIDADNTLEVDETGQVPGTVNDQFSIDEKDKNLRIATTVGRTSFRADENTANDLYVLNDDLNQIGSLTGMGLTERIFSARFIDDKAYLVTFRRVDPFHVIDLSDPENPELKGELKLPGFSSYLHPLSENRILGIGEEDSQVKAVIFDVSNDEPTIEESKILEDYSSEIGETHHAFLIDKKHDIFFLPASSGGYIFNYEDGIEQVKKVDIENPKRARYINDHLYIFSDKTLKIVDQTDWDTVQTLELN